MHIRQLITSVLLISAFAVSAQHTAADSTGIQFSDLTLDQALKKAAEENKIVFIDCFTQTCGPCKMMARKVFPQKVCGDYFNPRCVSLIRDMETGEGTAIAEKYQVRIYPTFLFLNPDGTVLLHYNQGAERDAEKFIGKIDNALEVARMKGTFDSGQYSEDFADEYLSRARNYDRTYFMKALAQAYADAPLQQLARPEVWKNITEGLSRPDNALFRRIFDDRKALSEILPEGEPYNFIMRTIAQDFRVRKNMKFDYPASLSELSALEKDGYAGARPLRMQVMFYDIISHGQVDRLGEITEELATVPETVQNAAERAEILNSLMKVNIILPPDGNDRAEFVKALDAARASLPQDIKARIDSGFARIGL